MICTAPLIFAAGGNRPRQCGRPATFVLSDGACRCTKHARGRGTPIEQKASQNGAVIVPPYEPTGAKP